MRYEVGLGYRKAVYTPFEQAIPNTPVIDKDNCIFFEKGTCKACEKFCPTEAIDFEQEDKVINLNVGNIILATGYDLFDSRRIPQYGYGKYENVFTSLEFERLANAAGPTNGEIVLRDGKTKPESVGIIHCVGSRDINYNEHCSAICCMQSLKFAHLVHERTGAKVYNFYIDIRTPAKDYEEFYNRVLEEGTMFIRGKVGEVTDVPRLNEEPGKLYIQAEDTLAGVQRRVPVDMVVLSAGLEPRYDANDVAQTFGISCSSNGWFTEKHPKLDPMATMTEGLFIAGCATGPKDIPATVAQGAGAAARVLSYIEAGELELEPVRASVDETKCSGCLICNDLCPFNAIEFIEEKGVSFIQEALCQGCGTCVAACPAGAISGTGFSNEQVMAQIDGLLMVDFLPAAVKTA
ncbi:MAG: CoB--CoM heterodisulfide reductase iron-sulfur subunit A family protein [Anaerolineales bacterium]|jgi:heterodisulfide reductase subunit A